MGLMASLLCTPEQASTPALDESFPELRVFADSFDFATLDILMNAHVPYVVLLVKLMDQ